MRRDDHGQGRNAGEGEDFFMALGFLFFAGLVMIIGAIIGGAVGAMAVDQFNLADVPGSNTQICNTYVTLTCIGGALSTFPILRWLFRYFNNR